MKQYQVIKVGFADDIAKRCNAAAKEGWTVKQLVSEAGGSHINGLYVILLERDIV